MSKDTINPKRWILTQEQIDAYKNWLLDRNHVFRVYADDYEAICEWEKNHPCPLPNPVEIPSDEEIDNLYYIIPKHDFDDSIMDRDTYVLEQNCRREAVKHFKKKILNLNI